MYGNMQYVIFLFVTVKHGRFSSYINVGFIPMQASLESERQGANDSERKYNEAQESSEDRRKKLEETEKKVHQLQESLTR